MPSGNRTDETRPTLPARLANWLHVHLHQGVLSGGLLSTVIGRHQDLILALLVIAQLLGVPDVAWREKVKVISGQVNHTALLLNPFSIPSTFTRMIPAFSPPFCKNGGQTGSSHPWPADAVVVAPGSHLSVQCGC